MNRHVPNHVCMVHSSWSVPEPLGLRYLSTTYASSHPKCARSCSSEWSNWRTPASSKHVPLTAHVSEGVGQHCRLRHQVIWDQERRGLDTRHSERFADGFGGRRWLTCKTRCFLITSEVHCGLLEITCVKGEDSSSKLCIRSPWFLANELSNWPGEPVVDLTDQKSCCVLSITNPRR